MSVIPKLVGCAICLLALAAPACAQPLTLAEAQRLAVARSEKLVANEAAVAATRDMAVAAGQLPDPVLKIGVDNLPLSGPERFSLSRDFMTMRRIGVAQELTRGEKRALRVERVEREGDRFHAERQLLLAEIQRETALAWVDSGYTSAMLDLLRSQLPETGMQVEAAATAFRIGRGSQSDIFAARGARVTLEDRIRLAERQQRNARLLLARWVGPEAAQRPLAGAVDWRQSEGDNVLSTRHLRSHPHLAVLEARVQILDVEVRQAQANTVADWTVEASYSRRGPAYSDMVSIGVSIPLQIDRGSRQNRELAAKVQALAEADAKLEDALRAEEAVVRVLLNDWTSGKQRLDQLTADLLPASRHRTEAALAAYRGGKAELGSVLAARRDEIEARLQVLALEQEVARLWAQLNFLVADPAVPTATQEQQ